MARWLPAGASRDLILHEYTDIMKTYQRTLIVLCTIPFTFTAARAQRLAWTWPGPLGQHVVFATHTDGHLMGTLPRWSGLRTCTLMNGPTEEMHVELPAGNTDTIGIRMDVLAFEALRLDSLVIEHHACAPSGARLRVLLSSGPLSSERVLADTVVTVLPQRTIITGLGILVPAPNAEYAAFTLRLQPIGPAGDEWVLNSVRIDATPVQESEVAHEMTMDERLSQFPTNRMPAAPPQRH